MLAIGVTGHRFLAAPDRVAAGIDAALEGIARAFGAAPWAVVSPLAEGADRLVLEHALARGPARLIVPLPLAVDDYLADFADAGSRAAFDRWLAQADEVIALPPADSRPAAYRAAGVYVLEHCDVLIAVWDGEPAQGPGGTGEIVALARARGVPLAWVRAANRLPGTETPGRPGPDEGRVTFERFPADIAD